METFVLNHVTFILIYGQNSWNPFVSFEMATLIKFIYQFHTTTFFSQIFWKGLFLSYLQISQMVVGLIVCTTALVNAESCTRAAPWVLEYGKKIMRTEFSRVFLKNEMPTWQHIEKPETKNASIISTETDLRWSCLERFHIRTNESR